jgi:hypothetical protein
VQQPPHQNRACDQDQPQGLIAPCETRLFLARFALGLLLGVRLDAEVDHGYALRDRSALIADLQNMSQYRDEGDRSVRLTSHTLVADDSLSGLGGERVWERWE